MKPLLLFSNSYLSLFMYKSYKFILLHYFSYSCTATNIPLYTGTLLNYFLTLYATDSNLILHMMLDLLSFNASVPLLVH